MNDKKHRWVEEGTMSHYLKGEIEMLEARADGDEERENAILDELYDRWDLMSPEEVSWLRRRSKLDAAEHAKHEKELNKLRDIIIDVMVTAYDWRCGRPESLREEDYFTGVWTVADDILSTLADKGFDWKKHGLRDPNEVSKK